MTLAIARARDLMQRPRTIFSTEDRLNRRGVRARATSWGWTWIKAQSIDALYVSCGIPQRTRLSPAAKKALQIHNLAIKNRVATSENVHRATAPEWLAFGKFASTTNVFRKCAHCGYADASLIVDDPENVSPVYCDACQLDACAIAGLALQEQGVNLGWRRPELQEQFSHLSRIDRSATNIDFRSRKMVARERGFNDCVAGKTANPFAPGAEANAWAYGWQLALNGKPKRLVFVRESADERAHGVYGARSLDR